jgi:hypothetical protein
VTHTRRHPYRQPPVYPRCPHELLRRRLRLAAPHHDVRTVRPRELLAAAMAESRTELARVDSKTSSLLTLATGVLAGLLALLTAGRHLSGSATLLLCAAGLIDTLAVAVLLWTLRTRLPRGLATFPDHGHLLDGRPVDPGTWHTDRLRRMAPLVVTKNRRFNHAVDLLLAELALLVLAALIEVIA